MAFQDMSYELRMIDQQVPQSVTVIGSGVGGPQALAQILRDIPANYPGAIIALPQMGSGFTKVLADKLDSICQLPVCEAYHGQIVTASRIYIIPSDCIAQLSHAPDDNGLYSINLTNSRKSSKRLDIIFKDTSIVYAKRAIGVLLTGHGEDGIEGFKNIIMSSGKTIAQDENSSICWDSPGAAVQADLAKYILPLWQIAQCIVTLANGEYYASAA